ncbi:hypothetical protein BDV96DRAFT_75174 [Lophiotrema nucula]|uniref:2EXR domain-containing protein n=1 Tax=Lophiotrema nucula TaxID=690887 RepID=A0A6A5Z8P5_9PLEO|nr:hypothetical protein BDV96DRAFT_75174 [Lophiotrema nucula]
MASNTTGTASFPQFQRLPCEIRYMIWAFALPPPPEKLRIIQRRRLRRGTRFLLQLPRFPANFHATKESRSEAFRHSNHFIQKVSNPFRGNKVRQYYGQPIKLLEVELRSIDMQVTRRFPFDIALGGFLCDKFISYIGTTATELWIAAIPTYGGPDRMTKPHHSGIKPCLGCLSKRSMKTQYRSLHLRRLEAAG